MPVRTASAVWTGTLKEGQGRMQAGSKAFDVPFTFGTRFQEDPGTNPEELVGAAQAGYQLSGFTLVFSFSTPSERPTYIGVANTLLAPVAALGPLLAGWLAELAGYDALFVALLAIGLIGLLGLHWRVPAPAREVRAAASE